MAARSVTRFWTNGGGYTAAAALTGDYPGTLGYIVNASPTNMTAGSSTDIFQNSIGQSVTKPTSTNATQFITIEKPSCTIKSEGRNQPIVNTTSYNVQPDGVSDNQSAFPGLAYPWPEGAELNDATGVAIGGTPQYVYSNTKLSQPIYILPGQTFENKFIPLGGVTGTTYAAGIEVPVVIPGDTVSCFVTYSVMDGADALIANKLVEMGYPVSMSNVDWYKRQLISEAGGDSQ